MSRLSKYSYFLLTTSKGQTPVEQLLKRTEAVTSASEESLPGPMQLGYWGGWRRRGLPPLFLSCLQQRSSCGMRHVSLFDGQLSFTRDCLGSVSPSPSSPPPPLLSSCSFSLLHSLPFSVYVPVLLLCV